MNTTLFSASLATGALAVAHTAIGEWLIFKRLRQLRTENAHALDILSRRRWDALWSTWHLLTILGFGIAAVLFVLAGDPEAGFAQLKSPLLATFIVGGVFWVYGTRGRHPAWIVLLAISALIVWS